MALGRQAPPSPALRDVGGFFAACPGPGGGWEATLVDRSAPAQTQFAAGAPSGAGAGALVSVEKVLRRCGR